MESGPGAMKEVLLYEKAGNGKGYRFAGRLEVRL